MLLNIFTWEDFLKKGKLDIVGNFGFTNKKRLQQLQTQCKHVTPDTPNSP